MKPPAPTVDSANAVAPNGQRRPGSPRLAIGVLVAAAVAGAVVLLRITPILSGWGGALALVGALVLVPSARELSRRFAINGIVWFGMSWVLYLTPAPPTWLGRFTPLLAVALGTTAALAVVRGGRRILPRVARADLLTLAAMGVAALGFAWWLRAADGTQALAILLPGWDNSAHVDMVEVTRLTGRHLALVAEPGGDIWKFADYPQGGTTVIAATMEALGSARLGSVSAELAGYANAVGLLLVLAVGIVSAALSSLRPVRSRPLAGLPACALLVATLVWGPGADLLGQGFACFVFACVMLMAGILILAAAGSSWHPGTFVALVAVVAGAAETWVPLLAMAIPLALVAAVAWGRTGALRVRSHLVWLGLGAAVALGSIAFVARFMASNTLHVGISVGQGGINPSALGWGCLLALALVTALIALKPTTPADTAPEGCSRGFWLLLALVPATGALSAMVLGGLQIRATGLLGYYAIKLLFGVQFAIVALLVGLLVILSSRADTALTNAARGQRLALWGATALTLSQLYGLTLPLPSAFNVLPTAHVVNPAADLTALAPPIATDLVSAATLGRSLASPSAFVGIDTTHSTYAAGVAQWYAALTIRWVADTDRITSAYPLSPMELESAQDVARTLLNERPNLLIVSPPDLAATLRASGTLGVDAAERIVTWS